jgi:hypothetical protein
MEMAVRSMETAETAMETDGDGSGGTSPSRQGAETETSVPQNLSVAVTELRNYSGKNADCFRVFHPEASYRRRGVVRSGPGASPQVGTARAWAAPPGSEGALWPLSGSRLVLVLRPGKIGVSIFVLSNSENISCVAFLKHKNTRKQELALWHLVSRLVPEIA